MSHGHGLDGACRPYRQAASGACVLLMGIPVGAHQGDSPYDGRLGHGHEVYLVRGVLEDVSPAGPVAVADDLEAHGEVGISMDCGAIRRGDSFRRRHHSSAGCPSLTGYPAVLEQAAACRVEQPRPPSSGRWRSPCGRSCCPRTPSGRSPPPCSRPNPSRQIVTPSSVYRCGRPMSGPPSMGCPCLPSQTTPCQEASKKSACSATGLRSHPRNDEVAPDVAGRATEPPRTMSGMVPAARVVNSFC